VDAEGDVVRAAIDASREGLAAGRRLTSSDPTLGDPSPAWIAAAGSMVSGWVPRWPEAVPALATIVEDAPDRETYRREALRLLDALIGCDTILLGDAAAEGDAAPAIRDFDPAFVAQFRGDPGR
jgi:hypothetical protein